MPIPAICISYPFWIRITDSEGNVLEENEPKLTNKIELKQSTWDMVHTGMYKVCNESSYRSQMGGLKVTLAGKSGTAQVSEKLPNHGLFIGYAPYENPEVAATLIIPNGHGFFKCTGSVCGSDVLLFWCAGKECFR